MPTRHPSLLAGLAGALAALSGGTSDLSPALAGAPSSLFAPEQDPSNAALVYWRLWAIEPASLGEKVGEMYDGTKPIDLNGPLAGLLRGNADYIESIGRATNLKECDFGVEYSAGILALLPHLSKLRATARVLAADAQLAAAERDYDRAAIRLAWICRISSQLIQDRTMISSLVSIAVASLVNTRLDDFAAPGSLKPTPRAELLAALRALPPEDPFGVRTTLEAEGRLVTQWIENAYTGADAGPRLAKLMAQNGGGPEAAGLAALDSKGIADAVAQARTFYKAAWEVFPNDDAELRLDALAQAAGGGEYGPLTRTLVPSLTKLKSADRKAREALAAAIAKVSEVK